MHAVNVAKKAASQKVAPLAAAIQKKERSSNTFEGKLVSLIGDKLVMTNKQDKEFSHTLAQDATLTCGGKVCKAEELKAGRKIRVTTNKDDRNVVISIEAIDNSAEGAPCCG